MDEAPDFEPDYEILEEVPADWFPFIMGIGIFVCAVLFGFMLALR